jgi:hypothetical protein
MQYSMHPSQARCKVLISGHSGAGKTTLLASLANAGYRLHIIDVDNGLDILANYLTPEGAKNVYYESLDKDSKATPGRVLELCKHWRTKTEDHGPTSKMGEKDVLVLDSINFFAQACLNLEREENGEIKDERQFFKKAGPAFDKVLTELYSNRVVCNVVALTHLREQTTEDGTVKALFPNALGKAFSKSIPQYFNNSWRVDVKPGTYKRVLRTASDNMMMLKCSAPKLIKPEEEPDLAALFDKCRENAQKIKAIFEKPQVA